jgi:hypothetical protein
MNKIKRFNDYAKHGLRLKGFNNFDNGFIEFLFSPQDINKFLYWRGEFERSLDHYQVLSIRNKILFSK